MCYRFSKFYIKSYRSNLANDYSQRRWRCSYYLFISIWMVKRIYPSTKFWSLMRLRRRQCIPSCSSRQRVDEDDIFWTKRKDDDKLAWSQNSAQVTSDSVPCFSNAMVGPRSWIGGLFNNKLFGGGKSTEITLNPVQAARLQRLQERMSMPFDETRIDHQASLLALWKIAFPNVPLSGFISEQWKEMGWQGCNPSTDFRGCGFISLENLLFFARTFPACFFRLLFKKGGKRAAWEYPFAVAGINVSFMLIQMLDLATGKPKARPAINFVRILGAFAMMDAQWLAMEASYMEFNDVLRTTRIQLERELCLEDIKRISDIPAYDLLFR
ncbi:uncharacterized protein LOC108216835 isoform X2 [Daucus carota subsp. sativus]|uniref:uncharacterized protein LOC108216835 isoform X2 n=1 Tax=Daucus carota subsp. sativus TaxID=79200 RepID=UPI003082AE6F